MKKSLFILLAVFCISGNSFALVTAEAGASSREAAGVKIPHGLTQEAAVKPVSAEAAAPNTQKSTTQEAASKPATVEAPAVSMPLPVTQEAAPTREAVKVKFKDVPDDHWAASSVYDLVNMGVTQGYPDGTFRGSNNITRYETAMFLSKLATAIGKSGDETEINIDKIKDDLRSDIRSLRADVAELKRMPEETQENPISGSFTTKIIFGNLVAGNTSIEGQAAPVGPLVRYRLNTTFTKSLSDTAKVKVNIDTMDSGFGGGSSDLSTRILDVEGDMSLEMGLENPVDVKVTSGPGPVVHTEEADANGNYIARSENGVVYVRPWNSVMFSSKVWGMDLGLGYIARKVNAFGEVDVNQIKSVIGFDFPGMFFIPSFKLNTNIDYLTSQPQASPAGPTDTKVTFDTSFAIYPKLKMGMLYSFGQGEAPSNAMAGMQFDLLDMWDTGTTLNLKYRKVGAQYLHENDKLAEDLFAGLDVFNRYIGDGNGLGIVDVGGELVQVITENVRIVGKTDWRLAPDNSYSSDDPQCSLIIEGGVSWNIATDTLFDVMYRAESIPSAADKSTDMLQLSLNYKF
jgi:S-layer homology domain